MRCHYRILAELDNLSTNFLMNTGLLKIVRNKIAVVIEKLDEIDKTLPVTCSAVISPLGTMEESGVGTYFHIH
jgi:hypothetical protein